MTFVLAANSELTEGKKTLQSGDLDKAIGHQVKVRYIVSAGSKVADRLEVSPAAPAHTSAPPARPEAPPVKK